MVQRYVLLLGVEVQAIRRPVDNWRLCRLNIPLCEDKLGETKM